MLVSFSLLGLFVLLFETHSEAVHKKVSGGGSFYGGVKPVYSRAPWHGFLW